MTLLDSSPVLPWIATFDAAILVAVSVGILGMSRLKRCQLGLCLLSFIFVPWTPRCFKSAAQGTWQEGLLELLLWPGLRGGPSDATMSTSFHVRKVPMASKLQAKQSEERPIDLPGLRFRVHVALADRLPPWPNAELFGGRCEWRKTRNCLF